MANSSAQEVAGFRITLTGPGMSLEREITEAVALSIVRIVFTGGQDVSSAPETPSRSSVEQRQPKLSIREYLDDVGPRSNPEKITAFVSFLRDHDQREDCSKEEVKACFRAAGEPLPGNFHRDFQQAVQEGWVASDTSKDGRYYLTRKGEEALRGRTNRQTE